MKHYCAKVYVDDSGIGFTIPDLPGFVAHVETDDFDIAVSEARMVLAGHVAALLDAGGELPEPRNEVQILDDEVSENKAAAAADWAQCRRIVMLPALIPGGRTRRVNISIDEATLALIDRAAHERSLTRSALIAEAARKYAAR